MSNITIAHLATEDKFKLNGRSPLGRTAPTLAANEGMTLADITSEKNNSIGVFKGLAKKQEIETVALATPIETKARQVEEIGVPIVRKETED